jgi:hypothetical protein
MAPPDDCWAESWKETKDDTVPGFGVARDHGDFTLLQRDGRQIVTGAIQASRKQ